MNKKNQKPLLVIFLESLVGTSTLYAIATALNLSFQSKTSLLAGAFTVLCINVYAYLRKKE